MPPNVTGEEYRESFRRRARARRDAKRARASAADRLRTVEQIATENHRRQALLATGTDSAAPHPAHAGMFEPVTTGFERAARSAGKLTRPQHEYVELPPLDLSELLAPEDPPPGTDGEDTGKEYDDSEGLTGLEDWL